MSGFAYLSSGRFAGAGTCPDKRFGIAGIAWDGSVTNRPGARFGPRAIREASQMLCDAHHPYFDVSLTGQLSDWGDLPLPNTSLADMRAALAPKLPGLIREQHMVWLGGDHSITLPLLRAYRAHHGQPLALIHFDAHCDTWTDHFGEPSGHGTWVYEALQEGLVRADCTVQLGLRSSSERAAREYVADQGGLIFDARSLRGLASPAQLAPITAAIRERMQVAGHPPLYLSFDIDALDPAFAPGTGTPEPGGLSTAQAFTLLEELADLNFVGMDCVEVAPAYDHAELTAYAAAQLVWTYCCGQLRQTR
ncbi:agmatinase [Inhella sp.]|uniref:agmatinase n=1 Tax=Inhella sp. TaxID=1921806 RepID=UPI0035AEB5DA